MATNYGNKTCYDCGVRDHAGNMKRVTESYNSGRSDNRVTAGNLAWAAFSDTAAKKVKRTIVANNRRSYTRTRTVWKCMDCSGHNAQHRKDVASDISKGIKAVAKAKKGGWFSTRKELPSEVQDTLSELKSLRGSTSSQTSEDLLNKIKGLINLAPKAVDKEEAPAPVETPEAPAPVEAKPDFIVRAEAFTEKLEAFNERMDAKAAAKAAKAAEAELTVEQAKAKIIEEAERKEAKGLQPLAWYHKMWCWIGMFHGGFLSLILIAPSTPENDITVGARVFVGIISAVILYPSIRALWFRRYNKALRAAKNS